MTRAEHLKWAKDRALEYVDAGDLAGAVTSMASDLGKHPDLDLGSAGAVLILLGAMDAQNGNAAGVRRWVEGFN